MKKRATLTLNIEFSNCDGGSDVDIQNNLLRLVSLAYEEGLLSGNSEMEVDWHDHNVNIDNVTSKTFWVAMSYDGLVSNYGRMMALREEEHHLGGATLRWMEQDEASIIEQVGEAGLDMDDFKKHTAEACAKILKKEYDR